MSEEIQYPDLLVPLFMGDSDILHFKRSKFEEIGTFNETFEPKGLYSFFPIFREGRTIVVLDPYEPTKELFSFTFKEQYERYALFFRPENDILSVMATTLGFQLPQEDREEAFAQCSKLTAIEVRKALTIDEKRGKVIGFDDTLLESGSIQDFANIMSLDNRFGIDIENESNLVRFYLLFHNVSND